MSLYSRALIVLAFLGFSWSKEHKVVSLHTSTSEIERFLRIEQQVDSIYARMSLDERIAQMMILRAHSDKGADYEQQVGALVETYQPGGLCFFQGTPERQIQLVKDYQAKAKIPLLISMDAEWGLGMRLKEDAMSFPQHMTLGAMQDDKLIYQMGRAIGKQLLDVGVHMNYAPVIDVNNNKNNPVINERAFGADKDIVARKGAMYMQGLQDAGVMACVKHFPGHGDTDVDSHYDLPIIKHDRRRLDSIELIPFRRLFGLGVESCMVAHLNIPALQGSEKRPASLDYNVVTELLKNQMGFSGLIITDGMEMHAVTNMFPEGIAEAEAFKAGNDIICLPRDVNKSIAAIKQYLNEGKIPMSRLDESVKKILTAKLQFGLNKESALNTENLEEKIFPLKDKLLVKQMFQQALTLVRNQKLLVPLTELDIPQTTLLAFQTDAETTFEKSMRKYGIQDIEVVPKNGMTKALLEKLKLKKQIVLAVHGMNRRPKSQFGLRTEDLQWMDELQVSTDVILVLFGNPYALQYLPNFKEVVVAYEDVDASHAACAQALNGAARFSGKLPVNPGAGYYLGMGEQSTLSFKMGYAAPEEVGMNSLYFDKIDSVVAHMIKDKAAPGCQVLVAKDGKIIFEKAYGHFTYEEKHEVQLSDLYDLASMTKVLATTYSLMHLFEQDQINIFKPMSDYLTELKGTNKEDIIIEDVLMHRSGLKAWIPFYKETLGNNQRPDKKWYSKETDSTYTIPVAEKLYMHQAYRDSIFEKIYSSDMMSERYRYSDLGFIMFNKMIEEVSGLDVAQYSDRYIFKPLGLQNTTFNPLDRISKDRIAPTEEDRYFRYQRLQGNVHDMGAAMMGGVSGHAGLFSNVKDVAVLMQTMLNGGYYAEKRLLHPVTAALFTARPGLETRRGLGWDMKQLDPTKKLNTSEYASFRTFGHLGFTGTATWADPTYNLVYVFLSNRTYPDMNNKKLARDNYRSNILSLVYQSMQ